MNVSEIFYSLQGEGFLAGVPSIFVRLAGCPLRCDWCDTKYAWDAEAGRDCTIEQIIDETEKWNCSRVVITGGEPMVKADMTERKGLRELLAILKDKGKHITIETAGIKFIPDLSCDLMSISPKPDVTDDVEPLRKLIKAYEYQLKFVIDKEADLVQVEELLARLARYDPAKVMLMPQAATRQRYLEVAPMVAGLCKQSGFAFSPRLQVLLWDNAPGR